MDEMKTQLGNCFIILLGNKLDLLDKNESQRRVSTEEAKVRLLYYIITITWSFNQQTSSNFLSAGYQEFAEEEGIAFMEIRY